MGDVDIGYEIVVVTNEFLTSDGAKPTRTAEYDGNGWRCLTGVVLLFRYCTLPIG